MITEPIGRLFDTVSLVACGLLTIATVTLVVVAIVMRYVLGAPLTFSCDLSVLLFAWMVFLGIGLAEWRRAHLSVDLIDAALPAGPRRLRQALRQLALVALSLWFAWLGWKLWQRSGMIMPSLRIPIAWLYASLPIGFVMLALAQLLNVVEPRDGARR